MRDRKTSLPGVAIKIAVPVALLAWLFIALDAGKIVRIMAAANPLLFFASFAVLCFRNVIGAARSLLLLRSRDIRLSLAAISRYYFMGNFFNLFLPEVIGRDLARGYYLYSAASGLKNGVSSIVAERFTGTAAMMLMSFLSVVTLYALDIDIAGQTLILPIAVVFGLFALFTVLLFNRATDRMLMRLSERFSGGKLDTAASFVRDVTAFYSSPGLVIKTLLISFVFQFVGVVAAFMIARALGDTTDFVYFLILLPVIWVIGMLPVSINGLGLREGSFVIFFGAVGMVEETAMAISLLWFVLNIGLGIIGGVFVIMEKKTARRRS